MAAGASKIFPRAWNTETSHYITTCDTLGRCQDHSLSRPGPGLMRSNNLMSYQILRVMSLCVILILTDYKLKLKYWRWWQIHGTRHPLDPDISRLLTSNQIFSEYQSLITQQQAQISSFRIHCPCRDFISVLTSLFTDHGAGQFCIRCGANNSCPREEVTASSLLSRVSRQLGSICHSGTLGGWGWEGWWRG